ncbi:uncharacterized protein LOC135154912 [Lytechinus pictus]|uniref:uncharacterized protein LOC135154912 n=1 Tax=Lytechinus pictus TaxID=7653 RepID=UPI0030BA00E4
MADRQQVKVALWCIPRSRSTVLTKCLSAIEDIDIYFELYSVAALVGGCFETATGRKLPLKLDGNETAYEEAKDVWFKTTNMKIYPRRVSCHDIQEEVETTKSRFVLMKEMCQYKDYAQDYLPRDFRYVFVTREPTRAYASFRKVLLTTGLFVPADKKLDIIRDDPSNTRPMSWYESQHQLWRYVKDNLDPNPIIIDAYDLASNPQKIKASVKRLVSHTTTAFSSGPRASTISPRTLTQQDQTCSRALGQVSSRGPLNVPNLRHQLNWYQYHVISSMMTSFVALTIRCHFTGSYTQIDYNRAYLPAWVGI